MGKPRNCKPKPKPKPKPKSKTEKRQQQQMVKRKLKSKQVTTKNETYRMPRTFVALVLHLKRKTRHQFARRNPMLEHFRESVTQWPSHFDLSVAQQFEPRQIKKLIIRENHFNEMENASIGRRFGHIQHLTIYDEFDSPAQNIDLYCKFVSMFTKVESFSLVVLNSVLDTGMKRVFQAINSNLAPLEVLHLYVHLTNKSSDHLAQFSINDLDKTLPFLKKFSLGFPVRNQHEILKLVGRDLGNNPHGNITSPLQSLSISVKGFKVKGRKSKREIGKIFVKNPQLSKVTQLQLTEIVNDDAINAISDYLAHFTQVQKLMLWAEYQDACQETPFTEKWVTAVSRMSNLRELELYEFQIQTFDTVLPENVHRVRRLKLSYDHIFFQLSREWHRAHPGVPEIAEQAFRPFVVSMAQQFPNLEQLTIEADLSYICWELDLFKEWCTEEFPKLENVELLPCGMPIVTL